MPLVDFVFDHACPNVDAARANLVEALSLAGVRARWEEHRIGADDAPSRVRGFGSPTVLVDGLDVVGARPGAEDCCRLYGRDRAPSVDCIVAALRAALAHQDAGESPLGRLREEGE